MITKELKYKVWIDYVVTMCYLNNDLLEHDINCEGVTDAKEYPALGIKTKAIERKHNIKTFDEFCEHNDNLFHNNLNGWYFRFKDRIDVLL